MIIIITIRTLAHCQSSDGGPTIGRSAMETILWWPNYIINSVDRTKLSSVTPTVAIYRSSFKKLPHALV